MGRSQSRAACDTPYARALWGGVSPWRQQMHGARARAFERYITLRFLPLEITIGLLWCLAGLAHIHHALRATVLGCNQSSGWLFNGDMVSTMLRSEEPIRTSQHILAGAGIMDPGNTCHTHSNYGPRLLDALPRITATSAGTGASWEAQCNIYYDYHCDASIYQQISHIISHRRHIWQAMQHNHYFKFILPRPSLLAMTALPMVYLSIMMVACVLVWRRYQAQMRRPAGCNGVRAPSTTTRHSSRNTGTMRDRATGTHSRDGAQTETPSVNRSSSAAAVAQAELSCVSSWICAARHWVSASFRLLVFCLHLLSWYQHWPQSHLVPHIVMYPFSSYAGPRFILASALPDLLMMVSSACGSVVAHA